MRSATSSRSAALSLLLAVTAVTSCATGGDDGGITDYWPAPSISTSDPGPSAESGSVETYESLPGCEPATAYCSSLSINGYPVISDRACPPEYEGEVVGRLECRGGFWRLRSAG